MRYEDAAKIGTNVEGYVRCTYAKLLDDQNGFIFALQHHDAWKLTDAHLQASDYFGGEHAGGDGALRPSIQDVLKDANLAIFTEDVPVVKAIAPRAVWGGKKMIECKLTDYCRDMLYRKAKAMYSTKTKYKVERVYIRDRVYADGTVSFRQGDTQKMLETYDKALAYASEFSNLAVPAKDVQTIIDWYNKYYSKHMGVAWAKMVWYEAAKQGYVYVIDTIKDESEKQANINELLNPDTTFLVKEVAIDWFPTNMKGAFIEDPKTGKLVTIDVALDEAKKRYDRSKAILAAVSTLTII